MNVSAGVYRWISRCVLCLWLVASVDSIGSAHAAPAKIIEFGWDSPSMSDLVRDPARYDESPFDGTVWWAPVRDARGDERDLRTLVWSATTIRYEEFDELAHRLRAVPFSRLKENFLRIGVTPGTVGWFDDAGWSGILHNLRGAASLATKSGARGLFFDTEQYQGKPFSVAQGCGTHLWSECKRQAKERGIAAIGALQSEGSPLTILFSYAHSAVAEWTGRVESAIRDHDYALLPDFIDGMLSAAEPSIQFVDGYENSYGFRTAEDFSGAVHRIRFGALPLSSEKRAYLNRMQVGFGLWLDYRSREIPWSNVALASNYRPPQDFGRTLRSAVASSDGYVWVYTERVAWWPSRNIPLVPKEYRDIVREIPRER